MELRNFEIPKHVYVFIVEGQVNNLFKSLELKEIYLKSFLVSEEVYEQFKLDTRYACVLPCDLIQALESIRPCFNVAMNTTVRVFKLNRDPTSASRRFFIFSEDSLNTVLQQLRNSTV